jgi:hypothetical protein
VSSLSTRLTLWPRWSRIGTGPRRGPAGTCCRRGSTTPRRAGRRRRAQVQRSSSTTFRRRSGRRSFRSSGPMTSTPTTAGGGPRAWRGHLTMDQSEATPGGAVAGGSRPTGAGSARRPTVSQRPIPPRRRPGWATGARRGELVRGFQVGRDQMSTLRQLVPRRSVRPTSPASACGRRPSDSLPRAGGNRWATRLMAVIARLLGRDRGRRRSRSPSGRIVVRLAIVAFLLLYALPAWV